MSSKKKKKPVLGHQPKSQLGGKTISPEAFNVPDEGSTDHLSPVFSFIDCCPNHFQLSDWQFDELKALMATLRDLSGKQWSELRKIKGFKSVDSSTFSCDLPAYISPEVTIWECRVSGRARIFGHRSRNVFKIVWFDRNHEVYPMS
ncbi:MAG6450 family protein [Paenibacillus wynnii]|uniref:Uncharacterized protein n=1 Tax=Paenibacillus wynnii TaxID=268407 RepID=A0A098MDP0_9BACL|nr:hypothetical protein [Paenibacillus wynnii]KGE20684.1 hypothetical protein PWYN_00355 [Paenibacillus wynnii]